MEKVLGNDVIPNTNVTTNNSQNSQNSDGNSESSQIPPEDRIELYCNEVVSIFNLNILVYIVSVQYSVQFSPRSLHS